MCGRYSLVPSKKQPAAGGLDELPLPVEWKLSFNIAPTHQAPVLVKEGRLRELRIMEWGLVPQWQHDGINGGKLINARWESAAEKPSFKEAWLKRRCLVPADSFYEWRTEPDKRKTPYRILLESGELMFMAGLWECWKKGSIEKFTFTILTSEPNREMRNLHNRMPVILTAKEARDEWLEGAELRLPDDGILKYYRVSDQLNRPDYDAPDLHEEIPDVLRLF